MKTRLLLSVLYFILLLTAKPAFAQSDFRKGFIISATNDTTFGYVDYRGNVLNSRICSFKASREDNVMQYTSDDIKGYGFFNDKFYQSEIITSEKDTAKVFIEVLIKGTLNLYYYRGRFFVQKADQDLLEIKEEIIIQEKDKKRYAVSTNKHLKLLAALTYECPIPVDRLEKLKLNQKELTEITENYNTCVATQNGITYKEYKPWRLIQFGVLAGINTTSLSFTTNGEESIYLSEAEFIHTPSPTIGVFLNVQSPRIDERLSLQLEALYNQDKFLGYSDVNIFNTRSRNDMTIELSKIRSAALARYTFPQFKIMPYVGAGVAGNFILSSKSERIEESQRDETIWISYSDAIDLSKRYLVYTAMIGGKYPIKKDRFVTLELKYEWANREYKGYNVRGLPHTIDFTASTLSFLVGFGI